MGKFFDTIPAECVEWASTQKMFWVGSAPLAASGHVNVSPKGFDDSFQFANERAAWYVDYTGSGNETISHIYEKGNGRVTIMFTAFDGPPRILRLFGTGKVYERGSAEFETFLKPDDERRLPGVRAIIWIDVHKVGTSCGYSVPCYDYVKERHVLTEWAATREAEDVGTSDPVFFIDQNRTSLQRPEPSEVAKKGMWSYWSQNNAASMDGLPGIRLAGRNRSTQKLVQHSISSRDMVLVMAGVAATIVLQRIFVVVSAVM